MPREANILSPLSQEYFRRACEATLGHPLEDLLEQEENSWYSLADGIRAVGELMQTNKADGPFVLGAQPSYTDFFIAGSLQSARMVDEGVFQRNIKFPGYWEIYEACLPYMDKRD
jgi:glutathione S-transferase